MKPSRDCLAGSWDIQLNLQVRIESVTNFEINLKDSAEC